MLEYGTDITRTERARKSGIFTNRNSKFDNLGHIHLCGEDKSAARKKLFLLRKGRCENCKQFIFEDRGEMAHTGKTTKTRCECIEAVLNDGKTVCTGIRWKCRHCHQTIEHGRITHWTKRDEA